MRSSEIARMFEESWETVVRRFTRTPPIWFSEKDLQTHLLCELNRRLGEMGDEDQEELILAYAEVPISLNPEEFLRTIYYGRPRRTRKADVYTADIAIVSWDMIDFPTLCLIAELKYWPMTIIPLYFMALAEEEEFTELCFHLFVSRGEYKELKENIEKIKKWRREGPSSKDIDYYLGRQKDKSQVEKMVDIVKAYMEYYRKEIHHEGDVFAYLCIVDDLYQDLEAVLIKEISRYNLPQQFRILFRYIPLNIEPLEAVIERLEAELPNES